MSDRLKDCAACLLLFVMIAVVSLMAVDTLDWQAKRNAERARAVLDAYEVSR